MWMARSDWGTGPKWRMFKLFPFFVKWKHLEQLDALNTTRYFRVAMSYVVGEVLKVFCQEIWWSCERSLLCTRCHTPLLPYMDPSMVTILVAVESNDPHKFVFVPDRGTDGRRSTNQKVNLGRLEKSQTPCGKVFSNVTDLENSRSKKGSPVDFFYESSYCGASCT